MKFSIKDFLGKCDQIRSFLQFQSHLLKKSLMENFIICAVRVSNEVFVNNGIGLQRFPELSINIINKHTPRKKKYA